MLVISNMTKKNSFNVYIVQLSKIIFSMKNIYRRAKVKWQKHISKSELEKNNFRKCIEPNREMY